MARVEGLAKVVKAIAAAKKRHAAGLEKGLVKAGLYLQRESQAIVPVDTGNLKAAAFTRKEGKGFDVEVVVGYEAAYAIYVHENLDAAHGDEFNRKHADLIARGVMSARGRNQQAKFLERPYREKRKQMSKIVLEAVKKEKG